MNTDQIVSAGINHMSAPVGRRESLAVLPDQLERTLVYIKSFAGFSEAVVLSTCSRVEVYGVAAEPAFAEEQLVSYFVSKGGDAAARELSVRRGAAAVSHLFRVACGLDSWIVGESEILGQVKQAYQAAFAKGLTGSTLNRAFQRALNAGKTVRAETGLQNGIHSIGGAAALLAGRIFGPLREGRIVVFGAGAVAEAVARHLAAKNFRQILVANRTVSRAVAVARALGGRAVGFEEGLAALSDAEAAIFSTASPEPLLRAPRLSSLTRGRTRSLFLIDLGLPRNVDPACAAQNGVYLYNLDDLKGVVGESMAGKAAAREQASALSAALAAECVAEIEKAARRPAAAGRGR